MKIGNTKKVSLAQMQGGQRATEPTAAVPTLTLPKNQKPQKTYVLTGGNFATTNIKCEAMSEATKNNLRRKIRYIEGATSVFVDEQGDVAGMQLLPITFERGRKLVKDPLLMQFLDLHPNNAANGGNIYKELNPEADAKRSVESRKAEAEAVHMALTSMKIGDLKAVARAFGVRNVSKLSDWEIREAMADNARSNPRRFIEMTRSELPKAIEAASLAIEQGIIMLINNGTQVAWSSGGNSFLTIQIGWEDAKIEFIANWLLTSEGATVLETIEKSIKR